MRVPLPAAFLRLPIAHRGLHDHSRRRVENSLAAVRAAVAAGYGIELDLQLSADAVPMVFHDDSLDRTTAETGRLTSRSAEDLSRIPLTGSDDCVARLADVLALVAGRVPLLIEIKDQSLTMSDTDGRLEAATALLLNRYSGPVAVMSFNPHSAGLMARLAPGIPRGLTTSAFDPADRSAPCAATRARLRRIPDYDATLSSFISHDAKDLARPRVAELKAAGAAILCWTVRSAEAEAEARRIADNVTFEDYLPPVSRAA